MIKIQMDVSFDVEVSGNDQEEIRERLRQFLQHHIVSEITKVKLQDESFIQSRFVNVNGTIKVHHG